MKLPQETRPIPPVGSPYWIPAAELERGCNTFEKHEGRDSMYLVATFLLEQRWGSQADMADALIVLLFAWNAPFYRYGMFEPKRLEKFLAGQWDVLSSFRDREITSLAYSERAVIRRLFVKLHHALQFKEGKGQGQCNPIAVAKTLHLLAPRFFPLWDFEIANHYGCDYSRKPEEAYTQLCGILSRVAVNLASVLPSSPKSLLKQIDEYNYAKYTKGWI